MTDAEPDGPFPQPLIEEEEASGASDVRMVVDRDGEIEWASPPHAELFGRPVSSLIGKDLPSLLDPSGRRWWTAVLDRGRPVAARLRVRCADGDERRIVLRGELASVGGEDLVICWAENRGDRDPESGTSERYRHLFHHSVAGAARIALDGEILEANRSLARILGVDDPSALRGETIPESDRLPEIRPQLVRKLQSEGTAENVELPFRRRDGSTGVMLFNARLVHEEDGGEPVIWATVIDITERKRGEKDRRRMAALVEHSEDAIIAKSLDGTIETWNAAAERMYGWTAEEAVGEPATMLVPSDVEEEFEALLERAAEGELVQGREIDRIRKDGTRFPISLTLSPIRGEDGGLIGISGINRDITELRRHEEELETLVRERTRTVEEQEAALRRAEKLEALGKLTGGVAHDFNNLLLVIDANLQFLRRTLTGDPEALERVETASEAVERGSDLTSHLLSFARQQPLEPRVVDPDRLLEKMGEMIRRTLESTIEIETHVEDDLWNSTVDPHRLESVILNLVINARDAMEGEGRLTIELANTRLDEDYAATRTAVTPGRYVCLAISDTGHGMTREEQARAFEPFFTTKGEEGTGLGLSMAYGFVKQSGGHIALYSEPGEGTTVRLYLPHTPEAEERIEGQPEAASSEGGEETVLVVEDDEGVRAVVTDMLEDLGYRVLEAGDGERALTMLEDGPEIDLLFTDVVMPGPVSGTDLAEQARALHPDLEVLFTSGYTENAIVHHGRVDPDVELLTKPYDRAELARAIRRTLGMSG
jgi:PAS domain S-box-containing protein